MEIKIVTNEQELQDAFSVRKIVFIDEQQVPEEEEIDQYDEEATHFVVYQDQLPIAAGRFRVFEGAGKVERICVMKDQRKIGAGRFIMTQIEDYAKEQGLSTIKLNAQTHAIPFYSGLGYEVVSEEFLDAGIPHRAMKKSI